MQQCYLRAIIVQRHNIFALTPTTRFMYLNTMKIRHNVIAKLNTSQNLTIHMNTCRNCTAPSIA